MAGDAHTQTEAIELIHSVIGYAEQRAGAPSQAHAALDAVVARLEQLTEALDATRDYYESALRGVASDAQRQRSSDALAALAAAGSSANPEEREPVCECGHTGYWHSHGGNGDCEFSTDCFCGRFLPRAKEHVYSETERCWCGQEHWV